MEFPRERRDRVLFWTAITGFVVAFGCGVIGAGEYLDDLGEPWDLGDRLYLVLQAFTLQLPHPAGDPPFPAALQVARFLGPAVLAYAAVRTLLALFDDAVDEHFRAWWVSHRRDGHIIICGLGYVGGSALRGLRPEQSSEDDPAPWWRRRRGEAVVAIEFDRTIADVAEARRRDVPVIFGEATDARTWRRAKIRRAGKVLIACGNDQFNGEAAAAALEALALSRRTGHEVRLMVHLDRPELAERHRESAERIKDDGDVVDGVAFETFSLADRTAARVLAVHPPFPPGGGGSPRVIVVGSDALSAAIICRIGQIWSTTGELHKPALPVLVADPDAERLVGELRRRFPDTDAILDLEAKPVDLHAFDIGSALLDAAGENRVYVCLKDEAEGLAVGLHLADAIDQRNPEVHREPASARPRNPVIVRTGRSSGLAELVNGSGPESALYLAPFSPGALSCDATTLFGSFDLQMARLAHEAYLGLSAAFPDDTRSPTEPSFEAWDALPDAWRAGNIAQVHGMRSHFAQVGIVEGEAPLPLRTLGAPWPPVDEDGLRVLSELEHERWMASKPGVVHGPDRTATTHPDMLPWPELAWATQRKDREAVLGYVRSLAALGLRLPDPDPSAPRTERAADWRCRERPDATGPPGVSRDGDEEGLR